jgi:predicted RNase H-like HicB family nuclease
MNVRILHHHEAPRGWWFNSPDLPGLSGSDYTFAAAKERAEDAARFHLTCEAEEQDLPAPDLDALEFEHFVPASEAPALAA